MSETETLVETEAAVEEPKAGFSLITKLLIAVFMAVVILTECAIAYLLIPSADEVAAATEARLAKDAQIKGEMDDEVKPAGEVIPEVEFDLGAYTITTKNGASMLHIDVSLAATLKEEDKTEFEELFEEKKKRFSQLVMFEFRSAEPVDLYANELGLIRRQILEKSNALFGKQIVRQVLVSAFSIVEQ